MDGFTTQTQKLKVKLNGPDLQASSGVELKADITV